MGSARRVAVVALAAGALIACAARGGQVDYRRVFADIERLIRQHKEYGKAQDELERVVRDVETPARERIRGLCLLGECFHAQDKRDAALNAWRQAEGMATEVGNPRDQAGWLCQVARLYLDAAAAQDAVRAAAKAPPLAASARDVRAHIQALAWLAAAHRAAAQAKESQQAYERLVAAVLANAQGSGSADWAMGQLLGAKQDDQALELAEACLSANPAAHVSNQLRGLGDRSLRHQDTDTARRCYALAAFNCNKGHAGLSTATDCQQKLANLELDHGHVEEGLRVAKLFFLACDVRNIGQAMTLMAKALKAADRDINNRVRLFLAYQRYGRAGQDGAVGTADDLADPLASIPSRDPPAWCKLDKLLASFQLDDCASRANAYLLQGQHAHALVEALATYRAAAGENVTDPVYRVASVLKALDGHVLRANDYLMYQKFGPAGEDGEPGTEDDLTDPIKSIELPGIAGRDARFEAAVAACGRDARGVRRKARLLLAWGKAQEGLDAMQEAYARANMDPNAIKQAILDVAGAIKAVDGHIFRANQYLLYQKHGKAGPDGVEGTEDDLANPLAQGKAPEPAPQP